MNLELKVAVWMVTCNHEKYIKKAIEGILKQQTTFHFELFIGVDYSKDLTKEICIEYQKENPNRIKLTIMESNIGATMNGINTYLECFNSNAKYIALCEGDDYWTNPLKLQKQVDFLELNQDFSICFHKVMILNNGELLEDTFTAKTNSETTILDLIENKNYINTASVVFRNKLKTFPSQFHSSPVGDYFLYILLTEDGSKIKQLKDKMAVYRKGVGIYSKESGINQVWVWYEMLILLHNYNNMFQRQIKEIKHTLEVEIVNTKFYENINYKLTAKQLLRLLIIRILKKIGILRT
jgi:glycosyltransferase involved in cell wall biosynthesis